MKSAVLWKVSLIMLLLLAGFCPVFAQTLETEIKFSQEDLVFTQTEGYDLVQVDSPRSYLDGAEGEPLLPVVTADVLLPAGARVDGVRTVVERETEIAGKFNILPAQKLVPTSSADKPGFVKPNPQVYGSSNRQRVNPIGASARKIMRGHFIAGIKINPVDYIPSEGKLLLRNKIRIYVDYTIEQSQYRVPRSNTVFEQMIRDSVLNPQSLDAAVQQVDTLQESMNEGGVVAPMGVPTNVVEYLIITKSEFADEFQVLADWKTKKGVPAEVVTLPWVYTNYTGANNQQKIKTCIRDYALNKGTVWVVLGTDIEGVPSYPCYSECSGYTDSTIPADLYYSDIDVLNWDGSGNGIAGELNDGVDMGPDVYVGRISVSSEAEVTAYINKALAYEKNSPAINFAEKMLLSGVLLWGQIDGVSDAQAQSELMWTSQIDPYWAGTRYRFYDTGTDFPGGDSYNVTPVNMNAQINTGYNFLHTNTHGNTAIWGVEGDNYDTDDVNLLMNADKYINILTTSCITNAFDNTYHVCLGEAFTREANAGAVSYIGCSRYGWGYEGTAYPGPSLQYNQTFYTYLFSNAYGNHLGEIFARMKVSKLPLNYYGADHWLQYGINLLGDPELPLYTANPQIFYCYYLSHIETGLQTFNVNTGTPYATVCLFKDNEIYVSGEADISGYFSTQINPVHSGIMDVTITAANKYPYEGVVEIGTTDAIAPASPTGLTATAASNQINLDWADNTEPDLMQYNIYRATAAEGPYNRIASGVVTSSYTDNNIYGLTYYYRVTAVDYSRNESAFISASAAPIDTIAPATPQRFSAGSSHLAVSIWWFTYPEPDLGHYNLYRSVNYGEFVKIAEVNATSYKDTDVVLGSFYIYYVNAEDVQGNQSPNTSQSGASPSQYLVATNLTAMAGDAQVTLDWDDVEDPNLLWFYVVERSITSGSGYQTVYMGSQSSMVDNTVANGTTYYYHVSAVNNQGQGGPWSNEVSATPHGAINPEAPAPPTNLTAVAGDSRVALDWSDNNEPDLSHYNVYRSTTNGCCWNILAQNIPVSSYTDLTASNGTTYYYVVKAVDTNSNESQPGNQASATPVNTPPATPTGLTGTSADRQAILNWNDNTELDLRGYNVYRSLSGGGTGYTPVAMYLMDSNFTDTSVSNGVYYFYRVASIDMSGWESPLTAEINVVPRDSIPPAAPTGLTATAGNAQVVLDWNNHSETDFYEYWVYRSTTSGGPYTKIRDNLITSAYTDTNVVNGTTYYYVVKNIDTSRNESPYSSQVSATPHVPGPVTYYPSSYTIAAGSLYSGTLAGLTANDNSYLVIQSQTSGTTRYARTDFTVTGISGTASRIDLQVISKSSNSSTTQKIYLYNFTTSAWDQKNSSTISTSEVTKNIAVTSGMSSYISGGQLKIRTEGYKTNSTTIRLSHEVVYAKITP